MHDIGNDFWFNSTAIQAAAGNVDSVSVDLRATTRKIFSGTDVDIHAMVSTTLVGATATVQMKLQDSADDTTFADVLNATTQTIASAVIPIAELVSGYEWSFPYSPNTVVRRYLRLRAVIATATITAGTITAGLLDKRLTSMR